MYNSVFRGFLNYYKFAHNYSRLTSTLVWILKQSCAKLLTAKFKLGTMKKTYDKFGPQLAVTHPDSRDPKKVITHEFLKPSYRATLKFLTNSNPVIKGLYGSISLTTLDNLICSLCESDYRVEMHHVRFLKDLNPKLDYLDSLMVKRNRKQIPLCRECHMEYHRKQTKVK